MKRTNIAVGIYRTAYGYAVIWKDRGRNREKHFPADTPLAVLKAYRKQQVKLATPATGAEGPAGSFPRDCVRLLRARRGQPSYKSDRSHLKPWIARFRRLSRHAITREAIELALADWYDKSPQERKHRLNILRQVFHHCDGPLASTPCDGIIVKVPKKRPRGVPDDIIQQVALSLAGAKWLGDGKTRARFLVLATCAKRPCQVMRARRNLDVNFTTRVWDVEPAKNSGGGPLYLNDEMLAAWKMFDAADAWGPYDSRSFAKTLRRHGWPAGVRPYNMRHQALMTANDRGADFGAIQQMAGHASPDQTRAAYVPHELKQSRLTSTTLEGRFDPAVFAPAETTNRLPTKTTNQTPDPKWTKVENTKDSAARPRLVKHGSSAPAKAKTA